MDNDEFTFDVNPKKFFGAVGAVIGIIFLIILFFSCTENITPGNVGVIYDRTVRSHGGVLQTPKTGFIWVNPITQRVAEYPIATRTVYLTKAKTEGSEGDDSFALPSKEGQSMSVDINFSYSIDAAKAPMLYAKFRGQDIEVIEQSYIRSNIKSAMQDVSGTYSILEIYGEKRSEIAAKAMKLAAKRLGDCGIVMETLNFGDIRPPESVRVAISSKIEAMQRVDTAKAQNQQAKIDADTAKTQAEGEANAILAKANAQAEANKKLAESLQAQGGAEYIQLKAIEAWDGHYPSTYIGSGSSVPLINLPASR